MDQPNPDMHVFRDGTVRLDPKKIRESEEYESTLNFVGIEARRPQ